jgi:hypothetical protein
LAEVGQAQISRVLNGRSAFDWETAERVGRLVAPDRLRDYMEGIADSRPHPHPVEFDEDGTPDETMREAAYFRLRLNFPAAAARYRAVAEALHPLHPRRLEALVEAAHCHLEHGALDRALAAIDEAAAGAAGAGPQPHIQLQLSRARLRAAVESRLDPGLEAGHAELAREAAAIVEERSRAFLLNQVAADTVRLHVRLAEHGLRRVPRERGVARHLDEALRRGEALVGTSRPGDARRALLDLQLAAINRMHYDHDSRRYAQFEESERLGQLARRYFSSRPHDPRGALVDLEDAHRHRVVQDGPRARRCARRALDYLSAVDHVPGQRAAFRLLADLAPSVHDRFALHGCAWACCPMDTSFEARLSWDALAAAATPPGPPSGRRPRRPSGSRWRRAPTLSACCRTGWTARR